MKEVKKVLDNIDVLKCFVYAEKMAKKQEKEWLEISPDGYFSDGLYFSKYDFIPTWIESYIVGKVNKINPDYFEDESLDNMVEKKAKELSDLYEKISSIIFDYNNP